MLNDKNYVVISDWMLEFNLNAKELLTYAIVYGFSQDNNSDFNCSLNYIANWLSIRRDNSMRYLNSLLDKGLINRKKDDSSTKHSYKYKTAHDKGTATNYDYIYITPWMVTKLGLQDKELILYALIHGFSRKGSDSFFTGNNSYLGKWLRVDKKHVSRYTSSLIKKNLIERIENSKEIKYRAIIPDFCSDHNDSNKNSQKLQENNKGSQDESTNTINKNNLECHQIEYTHPNSEEKGNQFEEDYHQIEYRGITKLSTYNLNNNLDNSLYIYNNKNISNIYNNSSYNNFLVVVNEKINENELFSNEKEMFNKKLQSDKELYEKYKDSKINIARIMKVYSKEKLYDMIHTYKNDFFGTFNRTAHDVTLLAEKLIFNTLHLKRYANRIDEINKLSEKQIMSLYKTACALYNTDNNNAQKIYVDKTPEAYFVGVVDQILDKETTKSEDIYNSIKNKKTYVLPKYEYSKAIELSDEEVEAELKKCGKWVEKDSKK